MRRLDWRDTRIRARTGIRPADFVTACVPEAAAYTAGRVAEIVAPWLEMGQRTRRLQVAAATREQHCRAAVADLLLSRVGRIEENCCLPWLIGVSLFPPGGTKSGVLDRAAFRMAGGSGDVTLMSTPMLLAPERNGTVQPEREDLSRVKLSALPLVVSPWAPTRDGLGAALCVAPRRWISRENPHPC